MTWYVLAVLIHRREGTYMSRQANGIDRPSFGATVIKNQSKYNLSEREQAWLVGSLL